MRTKDPIATLLLSIALCTVACDVELEPMPEMSDLELAAEELDLLARSECDGACSLDHCLNVARVRDEHADDGDACEANCMDAQIDCLITPDAASGCGTCEHQAAECQSACD